MGCLFWGLPPVCGCPQDGAGVLEGDSGRVGPTQGTLPQAHSLPALLLATSTESCTEIPA